MRSFLVLLLSLCLFHCGESSYKNPRGVLEELGRSPRVHLQAMDQMDVEVGLEGEKYQALLHKMLWKPGYTNDARSAALKRLWNIDREGTIRTIRQQIPRINNWTWLTELCAWIGQNNVIELKEGLISSWAMPTIMVKEESQRPEFLALSRMVGKDAVIDEVFNSMVQTNNSWQQGYRTRCWDLLHRLDERDRIHELLSQSDFPEDDAFLVDLRRSMLELGVIPNGREEIIWIRKLASPQYAAFWDEAVLAMSNLPEERKNSLELRDIPIVVSVHRHAPHLMNIPTLKALSKIQSQLEGETHYFETEGGGSFDSRSEMLATHIESLTWGDAMAVQMILQALDVPEVRAHLFDYAKRDLEEKSTEFGGVIALDTQGQFEILEFEPKIRHHDRRFNASQQMFDSAYTALFHFHFHAQKLRNADHAGPGLGDKRYAELTRANCLVFSFVNENKMNVDFYRHSNVVVDLGTITLN